MKARKPTQQLLIIGNGMVSARFCEYLVKAGVHHRYKIRVLGEEPRPAYNRVRLSTYVNHRDEAKLELLPQSWYREHGIEVEVGARVDAVSLESRTATTAAGVAYSFDRLVPADYIQSFQVGLK